MSKLLPRPTPHVTRPNGTATVTRSSGADTVTRADGAVPRRRAPGLPPEPAAADPPATADPPPPALRGRTMARWRDAVLEVQGAILSGTDSEAALHAVADVARHLADADVATVAVPRVAGTSLVLRAAAGHRAADLRGVVFPVEESLSGRVLRTRRPLHLADASRHADSYQPICELGDHGPAMLLPLIRSSEPLGTLLVARRRGREHFDADAFEVLNLFAGHVSVAVEFCRSQEELHRLSGIDERERVGRELHDTVLQRLFSIGLRLQALDAGEREASPQLQSVLDEIDRTVREIRTTVLDTGPR